MQSVQQYVGEKPIPETEILIYPGGKNSYTLFEDDGISYEYEKGSYPLTKFTCRAQTNACQITVKREHSGYKPQRQNYLFKIISDQPPVKVSVGNNQFSASHSIDELSANSDQTGIVVRIASDFPPPSKNHNLTYKN